jgi:NTP pyrophosphatase (non-canonical NTP hydrolase)
MNKLSFKKLNEINTQRCETSFHKLNDWSPTDWGCAVGGECGEALNKIKKLRRLEGPTNQELVKQIQTVNREELINSIGEELADIVIYTDLLASRLGLSLENCIINKFNQDSKKIDSNFTL